MSTFEAPEWASSPIEQHAQVRFDAEKDSKSVGTYLIGSKRVTLFGREQDSNDFVLANPSVSRNHAAIIHDDKGGIYAVDLMSRHGTYVEKKKIPPHDPVLLHEGDVLKFGQSTRSYILKGVVSTAPSAPVKRSWKLKAPRISAKFPGRSKATKTKYDAETLALVNSVCNGSAVTDDQLDHFCDDVADLPSEKAKLVVSVLVDKVKVKYDFKASQVHKNALTAVMFLVKENVAVEHVEDHIAAISLISQSRVQSDARTIARKILQLVAAIHVDPDGSGGPERVKKESSVSDAGVSESSYCPPVVPPPEPTTYCPPDSTADEHSTPPPTVAHEATVQEVTKEPVARSRMRVLSNEGKRLFVESHSPLPQKEEKAHFEEKVESEVVPSPAAAAAATSGFNFIEPSVSSPMNASAFGFISQEPETKPTIQIPPGFLSPVPNFDPAKFETYWESSKDSEEWTATLSRVLVENELEQMLEHENVKCLASGRVGSVQRFYFFAEQTSNGTLFMAEINVTASLLHLSATVKWCEMDLLYDGGHNIFIEIIKRTLEAVLYVEPPATVRFQLKASPFIDPASFEQLWGAGTTIGELASGRLRFFKGGDSLEQSLSSLGVQCLASGSVGHVEKYFFFAELETAPVIYLVEITLNAEEGTYSVVVKQASGHRSESTVDHEMVQLIQEILETELG